MLIGFSSNIPWSKTFNYKVRTQANSMRVIWPNSEFPCHLFTSNLRFSYLHMDLFQGASKCRSSPYNFFFFSILLELTSRINSFGQPKSLLPMNYQKCSLHPDASMPNSHHLTSVQNRTYSIKTHKPHPPQGQIQNRYSRESRRFTTPFCPSASKLPKFAAPNALTEPQLLITV